MSKDGIHIKINEKALHERIAYAQERLDSAVMRDCNKYVPFDSNMLRQSAIINTVIGSGQIIWSTPYAHYQYEGRAMVGVDAKSAYANKGEPKEYNGKLLNYSQDGTGDHWFVRAKKQHLKSWTETVREALGKKR